MLGSRGFGPCIKIYVVLQKNACSPAWKCKLYDEGVKKMNSQLIEECEQSFYKELYHMDHPGCSIVADQTTGRIYVMKKLKIYEKKVYDYLKSHRHPNIPAVYALWEDEDCLTVVEEYIQGDTLSMLLSENRLSDEQEKNIFLEICDALIFLHSADPPIIHRDIKAENIMVTESGKAVLIDYNAARIYRPDQKKDTVLLGTEGSAAPEQYGFGQSDARTDIYGMGVLLGSLFPEDRRMRSVAEKATKMDPNQRYQSAKDLKKAVEHGLTVPKINIPGFRTGKPWKMITAAFIYLIILYSGLSLKIEHPKSLADIWLNRIFFFLICGNLIDLFTDWTHFFRGFPLMKSKKKAVRIAGYILNAVFVTLFWMILLVLLENFL